MIFLQQRKYNEESKMNYARLIFEDTPAFVPVPREMQHRKTEIIFLPLDDELSPESLATLQNSVIQNEASVATKNRNLLAPDVIIRAERDAWED